MHITSHCLTPQRILQLRSDELEPEELAQIEEHLGECESCQRLLDDSAADASEWGDLRESLASDPQNEIADFPDQHEVDPDESTSLEHILKLLGPTDDPRMLGRIGSYEIVGVLGRGGMGVVFKGFDGALNRYVAIKMLLPHMAATGAARKRFAREAQAAAAVVDEHVMAIHGVSEWQGIPYLVMPYTRGISLQKRLAEQGPLELREILRIGMQAAAGLAAAHAQGLVHRDVKPANILLADGVERVTLVDFGLARAIDDVGLTRSGVLAGTPQYMSPEQARGQAIDARSDLFSLGSVLYATCTGRAPFRAESSYGVLRLITDEEPRPIRETSPDVPEWLCGIVRRLMAKAPADRFASAAEVAGLLERCLAHVQQPTTVPLPAEVSPPVRTRSTKKRVFQGVLAMLALAVCGLFGMVLWQATDPPDIAGNWANGEWGTVELTPIKPGEYRGVYTETHDKKPGDMRLTWSRVERRFNGSWNEGADLHGDVSIRLIEGEIRGSFTTDTSSKIEPGVKPKLGDLRWTRVERAALGRDATAKAQHEGDDEVPSVVSTSLRIRNVDGSPAQFNDVVEASVGYPQAGLPKWEASPNREGIVSLEKLPAGTHWLLAAGNGEHRTVFKVVTPMRITLPTGKFGKEPAYKDVAEALAKLVGTPVGMLLRKHRAWASKNIEIKPSVVIDERDREFGEIIVIEIRNNTKETLVASEEDVQLRTEISGKFRESVLVLSPGFALEDRTPFPAVTIEPGQSGTLRLNWQQWAQRGIWARRTGPITEPGLPEAEPGRMWVRVGLGNAGFNLVSVRAPKLTGKSEPDQSERPTQRGYLAFLAAYPKLAGLKMEMKEAEFKAFVFQNNLTFRVNQRDRGEADYWISMGDGKSVRLTFRNQTCVGIQQHPAQAKARSEPRPSNPIEPAGEYARFEGTWRVLQRTEDGAKLKGEFGEGETHVIQDRQMGDAEISLDPNKRPRHINVTFIKGPDKGKILRGIYEWIDISPADRPSNLLRISVSTKLTGPGDQADHRPQDFEVRKNIDFAIWERTKLGATQSGATDVVPVEDSTELRPTVDEPQGASWPVFRGNAQGSGVAVGTLPEKPSLLWKFAIESGSFEGTAAIADGRVFIADVESKLYCLDLATGKKKWEFQSSGGFKAAPGVRYGLVFIGDAEGKFHCLNAHTGLKEWSFETGGPIDCGANFHLRFVLVGSQDRTLYCLDCLSGKLIWKFAIADQIRSTPTVLGDRAFVAGCDGKLHVIDLHKGEEVASVPFDSPTSATPAVLGSRVFFGTEGGAFFAVDQQEAQAAWTVAWTFESPHGAQPIRSSPAVTESCVIFGGRNKHVQALNPKNGEALWTFAAKNRVDSSPVIVGQRAFIGSADGRIYALDIKNGQETWVYEAGGSFSGSPAVAENRLIIANENGVVYCFGEK